MNRGPLLLWFVVLAVSLNGVAVPGQFPGEYHHFGPVGGGHSPVITTAFPLDEERIRALLAQVSTGQSALIELPMPDGCAELFEVRESIVMAPGLAARFPSIRTFEGTGRSDSSARVRLELRPDGLRAMVFTAHGVLEMGPVTLEIALSEIDPGASTAPGGCCSPEAVAFASDPSPEPERIALASLSSSNPGELRVFRLAVAAQGEYTQYHGGTVEGALSAIVSAVNRINSIYEVDLGVRLLLIEGSERIIYTDVESDPYTVNDSSEKAIQENQINIDRVIGAENYDLGILFNTGRNGLAYIRSVCQPGRKASAVVGAARPEGYAFEIGLIAHEIAHQFGANHTFNSDLGECAAGRHGWTAVEPGSGSTIMSYAALDCGSDRLQPLPDPYFHARSIQEIRNFLHSGSAECAAVVPLENRAPTVSAGRSWVIPRETPFVLTAVASDPDNDSLTFCWEQMDTGVARPLGVGDTGSGVLFRTFLPDRSSSRFFPRMEHLLQGKTDPGEVLPETDRTMRFRVTARDGQGGVAWHDTSVRVDAQSGPFRVRAPVAEQIVTTTLEVLWDVAGTDAPPVAAAVVDLLLSLDGGETFPILLAAGTPNDGSETVSLPLAVASDRARLMVRASGHIFFAISPGEFQIQPPDRSPRMTSIQLEGETLELVWESAPGAWYQPQFRAGWEAEWVDLPSPVFSEGTQTRARFPHPVERQGFFRVRTSP